MRVKGIWIVNLPLTFNIGNGFIETELDKFKFEIEDIKCELIRDKEGKYLDRIKVIIEDCYDDKYLPAYTHIEYLAEFTKKLSHKVSSSVQLFLDGFTYSYRHVPYRIFDGEDFITPYTFSIEPGITSGSSNGEGMETGLNFDNHCLHKSIHFANKEKDYLDTAWFLLNDIEYYLDIGKFEVAIISMATMFEMLIKTTLNEYLKSNGRFKKSVNIDGLDKYINNGEIPSFADKYYRFGLTLISKEIDDDIVEWINIIYKTRNDIAHGKRLSDTTFIKEEKIASHEYYNYLHHMKNISVDVYNFFSDMKYDKILYDIAVEIRNSIQVLKQQSAFENTPLSTFPSGCCGYVSELLAMHLYEKGYFCKYVVGSKQIGNTTPNHVWLECKGFVIDITSDQFPEIEDKVYVDLVDYESDYLGFKVDRFYVREFDGQFMSEDEEVPIDEVYKMICNQL